MQFRAQAPARISRGRRVHVSGSHGGEGDVRGAAAVGRGLHLAAEGGGGGGAAAAAALGGPRAQPDPVGELGALADLVGALGQGRGQPAGSYPAACSRSRVAGPANQNERLLPAGGAGADGAGGDPRRRDHLRQAVPEIPASRRQRPLAGGRHAHQPVGSGTDRQTASRGRQGALAPPTRGSDALLCVAGGLRHARLVAGLLVSLTEEESV